MKLKTSQDPQKLLLFAITLVIYLVFALFKIGDFRLTGDEPHYLLVTHSLLFDGDIELTNNYANEDYKLFGRELPMEPHGIDNKAGKTYTYHMIGLSVLILPAYALGNRLLVVLFMGFLTALFSIESYSLCHDITKNKWASTVAWLSTSFTSPILFYSLQIYPEIPGGLLIVHSLRKILNLKNLETGSQNSLALGLYLSFLPWLHLRFIVSVGVLLALFLIKTRRILRRTFLVLIPLLMSGLAMAAYNYHIRGNPLPMGSGRLFQNLSYQGFSGLFLDQEAGLLVFSPIYILIFLGFVVLFFNWRKIFYPLFAVFVTYFAISASNFGYGAWWGGYSPAPRFLVSMVPLLAVAIAASYYVARGNRLRYPFYVLSLLSLSLAYFLSARPEEYLYVSDDGVNNFLRDHSSLIDLTKLFPAYFNPAQPNTFLTLAWIFALLVLTLLLLYLLRGNIYTRLRGAESSSPQNN
ncbi:hypothetical protein HKBW3C_02225 [Candidatus Hakubella thermalkaliphila]|nr:hypothetical protein HKBW3C_02225 [Candidatus Hakubella thermalkaliphila]